MDVIRLRFIINCCEAILTWILPFAFVGFYPAAYFIDPENWKWFALLTPVVGIAFQYLGYYGLEYWRETVSRRRIIIVSKAVPQGLIHLGDGFFHSAEVLKEIQKEIQ